jgi:DNA-binding FadR family transcriptional regulator
LVRLTGAIGAGLRASRQLSVHAPGGPASAMAEHQAVADAVIAGHPDDAERAMRELIVLTGSHLELLLRNRTESRSHDEQGPA